MIRKFKTNICVFVHITWQYFQVFISIIDSIPPKINPNQLMVGVRQLCRIWYDWYVHSLDLFFTCTSNTEYTIKEYLKYYTTTNIWKWCSLGGKYLLTLTQTQHNSEINERTRHKNRTQSNQNAYSILECRMSTIEHWRRVNDHTILRCHRISNFTVILAVNRLRTVVIVRTIVEVLQIGPFERTELDKFDLQRLAIDGAQQKIVALVDLELAL